ncbi:DUF4333 domain-containing protein [Gordonia sp. MP11Mi]|uniref:DUF4333 domain-containing protein n=1 Tax=Gordonia sp. MP11Mi TaxID=3022769 RepID=A0AA97GTI1_9ACTN
MSHLRPAAVIAALAALPLLSACNASVSVGDSTVLDHDKLTKEISTELDSRYSDVPLTVSNVECDDPGADPAVGTEFMCTATVGEAKQRIKVTTQNDDLDVKWVATDKVFDMPHAAKVLAPSVAEQVRTNVTVDCGTGQKALAPGSTFECAVSDSAGNQQTLVYTVAGMGQEDGWKIG